MAGRPLDRRLRAFLGFLPEGFGFGKTEEVMKDMFHGRSLALFASACIGLSLPAGSTQALDLGVSANVGSISADAGASTRSSGLDAGVNASVGGANGINANVGASAGGGRGINADADASIGGSNGVNANVSARTLGNSGSGANVNASVGGGDGTALRFSGRMA
jgi:hypothetical protein